MAARNIIEELIRHCNWERFICLRKADKTVGLRDRKRNVMAQHQPRPFQACIAKDEFAGPGCFRCGTFAIVVGCFWHTFWRWWGMMAETFC